MKSIFLSFWPRDFKKYFSFYYLKAIKFFNDLDQLKQNELEFCRDFIFPRPKKMFLPRRLDSLIGNDLRNTFIEKPTNSIQVVLNASILFNSGDERGAEVYLENKLEETPDSFLIGRRLAFLKLLLNKEDDADQLLEKYIENDKHPEKGFILYQARGLRKGPQRVRD